MKRWILLGLGDDEVDVLSQVARDRLADDIVVYHPDPDALVLTLAEVADLPRADLPPEPRADDVVVLGKQGLEAGLGDGWHRVGATVLEPRAVSGTGGQPGNGQGRPTEGETAPGSGRTGPETVVTPEGERPQQVDPGMESVTAGPPPGVWADPAATIRWLLEREGAGQATLWWDGGLGSWFPWIGRLGVEMPGGGDPPGLPIACRWGRFVLQNADPIADRLHPGMWSRLVEDLALRDLEAWRVREAQLREFLPEPLDADLLAWKPWLEEALTALSPGAALLWMEHGEALRLARAWGDGVGLTGELRLPKAVFEATFGADGPWRTWTVVPGMKLLYTVPSDRPGWTLALERLNRVVRGEISS